MSETRNSRIRFWSEIALSVFSVILAIVFITQVADIYYSRVGEHAFSREIVWNRLKYLIAPIVVWILGIIACFVLNVVFPREEKKRPVFTDADKVDRLRRKVPRIGDSEYAAARRPYASLATGRIIIYAVAAVFSLGVAIYTLVYLCDHSHFSSGVINDDILLLVKNVFPWILACLLLCAGAAVYEILTAKRALSVLARLLVLSKGKPVRRSFYNGVEAVERFIDYPAVPFVWAARGVIFVLAVVFIAVGSVNGGAQDVLYKAINICTECIGLG